MPKKAIIIGAGITGLSAAWKLSEKGYLVKVIEKENFIGGMSATFNYKDYQLDFGPHKIFTVLDNIKAEIDELYKNEELLSIKKSSNVRLNGKYLKFPFGILDIFFGLGIWTGFKCGMGYLFALFKNMVKKRSSNSYEEWVINRFGKPTFDLVLGPYARKIWGDPKELSSELAESRIAAPNLLEMIKQMVFGQKKDSPVINAEIFQYPIKGFGDISDKLSSRIKKNKGKIYLRKEVLNYRINKQNQVDAVFYNDGKSDVINNGDVIINTTPLPVLADKLNRYLDKSVIESISELKTRKLILLFVVLNADRVVQDNWLFFPEGKYRFNRIFEQKAFNDKMIPEGKTVICVELTCGDNDELWQMNDEKIYLAVKSQLEDVNLLNYNVIDYFTKRISNAYPVYDINYKINLLNVLTGMNKFGNLFTVGRQGGFSYTGMADSMDIGISTADFIIKNHNKAKEWVEYCNKFYNYIVVD